MFGEDVSLVLNPRYLVDCDGTIVDLVLQPQLIDFSVPHFSQPFPRRNTFGNT